MKLFNDPQLIRFEREVKRRKLKNFLKGTAKSACILAVLSGAYIGYKTYREVENTPRRTIDIDSFIKTETNKHGPKVSELYKEKKYDEAKKECEYLLAIDQKNSFPYQYLSAINYATGNLEDAKSWARKCKQLGEKKGDKELIEFSGARITDFTKELYFKNLNSFHEFSKKGDSQKALASLEQAIQNKKEDIALLEKEGKSLPDLLVIQSDLQLKLGDKEKQAASLKEALSYGPGNKDAIHKLHPFFEGMSIEEVKQICEKYDPLAKQDPLILNQLGNIYLAKKEMEKAKRYIILAYQLKPANAEFAGSASELFLELNDYDNAIKYAKIASERDPKRDVFFKQLYLAYNKKGDKKNALENLVNASSLAPDNNKYLADAASLSYDLGDNDNAIKYAQIVAEREPKNANIFNLLSLSYSNKEDYKNALENILKALALNKEDPIYLHNAGNINYKSGNYDEAIKFLKSASEKNPKDADNLFWLYKSFDKKGDKKNALENILNAHSLDQNNTGYMICAAVLYKELGDYDNAIKFAKTAVEKNPDEAGIDTLKFLYTCYDKKGEKKNALGIALNLFLREPEVPLHKYKAGKAYYDFGEYDEAIKFLKSASEKQNRKDADTLFWLYKSFDKKGDKKNALDAIVAASNLEPNNQVFSLTAGVIYSELKDYKNAAEMLEKGIAASIAAKTDPDASIYNLLGVTYSHLGGDIKKKYECYKKATEKEPKDAVIHYNLGYTYEELKDNANAEKEYKLAISLDPKRMAEIFETRADKKDFALAAYKELLKKEPKNAELEFKISLLCEELKDDSALTYAKLAAENGNKTSIYLNNYGRMLFDKENAQEALKHFELAIQNADAKDKNLWVYYANAFVAGKYATEPADLYEKKVIELENKDIDQKQKVNNIHKKIDDIILNRISAIKSPEKGGYAKTLEDLLKIKSSYDGFSKKHIYVDFAKIKINGRLAPVYIGLGQVENAKNCLINARSVLGSEVDNKISKNFTEAYYSSKANGLAEIYNSKDLTDDAKREKFMEIFGVEKGERRSIFAEEWLWETIKDSSSKTANTYRTSSFLDEMKCGQVDPAYQEWKSLLKYNKDSAFLNYMLGFCCEIENHRYAKDYYEAALKIEPDNPIYNFRLAEFMRKRKYDSKEFALYYNKAFELAPDHKEIKDAREKYAPTPQPVTPIKKPVPYKK